MVIRAHYYSDDPVMTNHAQSSLDDFHKLSLSVPLESTKYSFMSMFLDRVLNLPNESDILNTSGIQTTSKKKPMEILPQIAVPPDLWTKNDITIKNIKIKKVLLKNVNALLYQFLDALKNEELFLIEEQAILDFERKVEDFKLLEFHEEEQETRFGSLKEDDEDYYEEVPSPNLVSPTTNNSDTHSIASAAISHSFSTKSSHRLSSFSRDLMGGRRKKSQLNQNNPKIITSSDNGKEKDQFTSPPDSPVLPSPVTPNSAPKGSQLNNLLSKSRIYKQIQKRRESGASVNSSASVNSPSALSQRHNSVTYEPQETFTFSHRRQSHNNANQKVENQKDKYEYYIQTRALADIIKLLVGFIGKSGTRANLKRVMEFIKSSIFKFIVVDIAHMLIQRGNARASNGGFKA